MDPEVKKQLDAAGIWDGYGGAAATGKATSNFDASRVALQPSDSTDVWKGYVPRVGNLPGQSTTNNEAKPPVQTDQWGPGTNILNSINMGYGPQIMAIGAAATEGLKDLAVGASPGEAWHHAAQVYSQAKDTYTSAENAWRSGNPGADLSTRMVGGALGAIPALGAPELLLGQAGATAARIFPSLAEAGGPALRFIAGHGGSSLLGRTASMALGGARQGAELAAIQAPGEGPNIKEGAIGGGVANALLGPIAGPLTERLTASVSPEVTDLANRLGKLGVKLKGSQLTSGALGAPGTTSQLKDFTTATMRAVGAPSETASLEAVQAAKRSAGRDLEALQATTPADAFTVLPSGNSLAGHLTDIHNTASTNPVIANTPGALNKIAGIRSQIEDAAVNGGGTISGKDYQALTKSGSAIQLGIKDPIIGSTVRQIRDHMEEAQLATAGPEAQAALVAARSRYGMAKSLEPAAQKAESTGGLLNPRDVNSGVNRAVLRGNHPSEDLKTLAQAHKVLPTPTGTGEAKVSGGHNILSHFGGLGGAGIAGGALGAAAEHVIMPIIEGASMSSPGWLGAGMGAAGAMGLRALAKHIADSPTYANLLLGHSGWGPVALQSLVNAVHTAPQGAVNQLLSTDQNP